MSIDWMAALREQGDFAKRATKEIRTALDRDDLTLEQARSICGLIDVGNDTFDRFIRSAKAQTLDLGYYEAANILKDIWCALALDASQKLKIMEDRAWISAEDNNKQAPR
jgi:hypothetical protein